MRAARLNPSTERLSRRLISLEGWPQSKFSWRRALGSIVEKSTGNRNALAICPRARVLARGRAPSLADRLLFRRGRWTGYGRMVDIQEVNLGVVKNVFPDLGGLRTRNVEVVRKASNDRFERHPHRRKVDALMLSSDLQVSRREAPLGRSQIVVTKDPVLPLAVTLVLEGGLPTASLARCPRHKAKSIGGGSYHLGEEADLSFLESASGLVLCHPLAPPM